MYIITFHYHIAYLVSLGKLHIKNISNTASNLIGQHGISNTASNLIGQHGISQYLCRKDTDS